MAWHGIPKSKYSRPNRICDWNMVLLDSYRYQSPTSRRSVQTGVPENITAYDMTSLSWCGSLNLPHDVFVLWSRRIPIFCFCGEILRSSSLLRMYPTQVPGMFTLWVSSLPLIRQKSLIGFAIPSSLCDNPRFIHPSWWIQDLGGWFRTVQHSATNWYGMDEADPCAWGTGRHDSYVSTFRLVIDKLLLCVWTLTDLESGGWKPMEKLLPESRTPRGGPIETCLLFHHNITAYVIPTPHTGTCMYMRI